MGDIKKINKFDEAVDKLNDQEEQELDKSRHVVEAITGRGRKKQERKVLPTYIPVSMFAQFDAINKIYGISNNAAVNMLIRDYIISKKSVLDCIKL